MTRRSGQRVTRAVWIVACGVVGVGLLVAVIVSGIGVLARLEVITTTYQGSGEIRDGKRRGWIPSFVPDTVPSVHVMNNLDTNMMCGAFIFSGTDVEPLRTAMTPPGPGPLQLTRCRTWGMKPWPPGFDATVDRATLSDAGFDLARAGDLLFAIHWSDRTAYYASPRK